MSAAFSAAPSSFSCVRITDPAPRVVPSRRHAPHSIATRLALAAFVCAIAVSAVSPPGADAASRTYTASADARVESQAPTRNYGSSSRLFVDGSPLMESLVRFRPDGLTGPVTSAVLRLYVADSSSDGPEVYATDAAWSESGATWSNRPRPTSSKLADAGRVRAGTWVELDVTSAVKGDGAVSFVLTEDHRDGTDLHSREDTRAPELVVETGDEPQVPPAPPGNVIWRADGTSPHPTGGSDPAYVTEREWSAYSDDTPLAGFPTSGGVFAPWTHDAMGLTTSTGAVLPGKRSYRVYAPAGETRHELKQGHPVRNGFDDRTFGDGQDVWLSWAVVMKDYVHPPSGQWMVNQFRHINESGASAYNGESPHGLAIRSGQNWQWVSDTTYRGAVTPYDLGVPVREGEVLKLTVHIKWSDDPALGFMEVFLNPGDRGWVTGMPRRYQQTLLTNPSTGQPMRNHMRFGVYRVNSAGTIDDAPAESLMAGLVVASTRERAEYEAFGG